MTGKPDSTLKILFNECKKRSTADMFKNAIILTSILTLALLATGCESTKTINDGYGMSFEENGDSTDRVQVD